MILSFISVCEDSGEVSIISEEEGCLGLVGKLMSHGGEGSCVGISDVGKTMVGCSVPVENSCVISAGKKTTSGYACSTVKNGGQATRTNTSRKNSMAIYSWIRCQRLRRNYRYNRHSSR